MNTRELIENSLLDAMGLLDERETQDFERAFRSASPAVQAHVRREQTRLSHIEQLLPQVEPPAELRAAVIEAVRIEMELALEQATEHTRSSFFTLLPSQRVSAMWRAAAIGFMTAAVVFGVTTLKTRDIISGIEDQMTQSDFIEKWVLPDPELTEKYLYNDRTKLASFRQSADTTNLSNAAIYVQRESKLALFVCKLEPDQLQGVGFGVACELVEINAAGVPKQLTTFDCTGDVIVIEVKVELHPESRYTIREFTTDSEVQSEQLSTMSMRELDNIKLFG